MKAKQVIGGDTVQGGEAEVVDHDEVMAQESFDQSPDGVVGEAAVERFDQLVGLEEPDPGAGGDRGAPQRLRQVALADTGRAGVALLMVSILCRGGCGWSARQ